jgi:hypothetical protein
MRWELSLKIKMEKQAGVALKVIMLCLLGEQVYAEINHLKQ